MEQETTAIVIFVILFVIFCKNYINIYKTDNSYTVSSLIFIALQILSFFGTITNYEYFYLDFSGLFDIGNIAYGIGYNFMAIIALIIVIDKWKKMNRGNIKSKFFYTENCTEMQNLIQIWQSENSDYKYRILDLDSYKKLKTATAKIVFLFNLMLDMSDTYNNFRNYMNNLSTINNEYIKLSSIFLTTFNEYLTISEIIYDNLKDVEFFEDYKSIIYDILSCYKQISSSISTIQNKFQTQLIFGTTSVNSVDNEVKTLVSLTQQNSNNFEILNNIINENEIKFNKWKLQDSQNILTI